MKNLKPWLKTKGNHLISWLQDITLGIDYFMLSTFFQSTCILAPADIQKQTEQPADLISLTNSHSQDCSTSGVIWLFLSCFMAARYHCRTQRDLLCCEIHLRSKNGPVICGVMHTTKYVFSRSTCLLCFSAFFFFLKKILSPLLEPL